MLLVLEVAIVPIVGKKEFAVELEVAVAVAVVVVVIVVVVVVVVVLVVVVDNGILRV